MSPHLLIPSLTVLSVHHSFSFFFYCSGDHRALHSFPTRRSSDLERARPRHARAPTRRFSSATHRVTSPARLRAGAAQEKSLDRKSTRLNSSHTVISYAVFCLKKKKKKKTDHETTTMSRKASRVAS